MLKVKILPIIVFLSAVGCAHVHEVENTPEGVRVGIGGKEIKEGDRVSVTEQKCQFGKANRYTGGERCVDKKVGEAVVLKVLDQGTAIVDPLNGLIMTESMLVEKRECLNKKVKLCRGYAGTGVCIWFRFRRLQPNEVLQLGMC